MHVTETIEAHTLAPVRNAQAWRGPDMARCTDWIHAFTAEEIAELDRAVMHANQAIPDIMRIRREDFPLPQLEDVLSRVRREVLHGRGFFLFRGVPVQRYSIRESAIAYWGLSLYLV